MHCSVAVEALLRPLLLPRLPPPIRRLLRMRHRARPHLPRSHAQRLRKVEALRVRFKRPGRARQPRPLRADSSL